jgi:hypothetical protein
MTRAEIEAQYKVKDGVIISPGKFEGEPVYALYFYDLMMHGGADSDDDGVAKFNVTDEDRKEFPELADVKRVELQERMDGFVETVPIETWGVANIMAYFDLSSEEWDSIPAAVQAKIIERVDEDVAP